MGNELFFDEKMFISASRASTISGYNSDYIGQLCRKNLVECRRIGRTWFVGFDSLARHKSLASQTPRGRILFSREVSKAVNKIEEKVEDKDVHEQQNVQSSPVVPIVLETASPAPVEVAAFAPILKSQGSKGTKKVLLAMVVVGLVVIVATGALGNKIQLVKMSFKKSVSSLSGLVFSSGNRIENENVVAGASASNRSEDQTGIVVVPSAGSESGNEQVKKYVVDSFSDETEIVPDQSGNSGVLKPVFKNNSDQEYLYVIVPVKDGPQSAESADNANGNN